MSARAAKAATPAAEDTTPAVDGRQGPDGGDPERRGGREPERRPARARGEQHAPDGERADDEGVGAAQPARGEPHGRCPDRRATRAKPQAGDEEVRHRGIPEQHGPLAHDQPLQDERVPDRGERGDRPAAPSRARREQRDEARGAGTREDEGSPEDECLRRACAEHPAQDHPGGVARDGARRRRARAQRERRESRVGRPGEVVGEHDAAAEGGAEDQDGRHGGHEDVADEDRSGNPTPEGRRPRGGRHAERA